MLHNTIEIIKKMKRENSGAVVVRGAIFPRGSSWILSRWRNIKIGCAINIYEPLSGIRHYNNTFRDGCGRRKQDHWHKWQPQVRKSRVQEPRKAISELMKEVERERKDLHIS